MVNGPVFWVGCQDIVWTRWMCQVWRSNRAGQAHGILGFIQKWGYILSSTQKTGGLNHCRLIALGCLWWQNWANAWRASGFSTRCNKSEAFQKAWSLLSGNHWHGFSVSEDSKGEREREWHENRRWKWESKALPGGHGSYHHFHFISNLR